MKTLKDLPRLSVSLNSSAFQLEMNKHYDWMLGSAPVCRAKLSLMNFVLVAPHALCREVLSHPKLVRNRATATGGRAFPMPVPRSVELMLKGLITQDAPAHRRQRSLVSQAFTPKALALLEKEVESIADEVLDAMLRQERCDVLTSFCLPVPVRVIQKILGVLPEEMPQFQALLSNVTDGMMGVGMLKTLLWNFPRSIRFVDAMLDRKRQAPSDDILSALIEAEEGGEMLDHDELVAMTLTLILAGYETTVHLLGNSIVTLLEHPEQLAMLRQDPSLIDASVEELLRYCGPIHGTKPNYASEDIEIGGVLIPRGTAVIPVLGAANRDPAVFDEPDVFDITRAPNKQLGFGFGVHHCLGAALARMETKVALLKLLDRFPDLELAVPYSELKLQNMPLWRRYQSIPVRL